MAKAFWGGKVIAESNATVVVEGNQYFPTDAVKKAITWKSAACVTTMPPGITPFPNQPRLKSRTASLFGKVCAWKFEVRATPRHFILLAHS